MRAALSLRIAYRYLRSKKTHNAVNVISWISMCGVAVATAAIVIVMSVFNGFTDLAGSHLSLFDAPLKVVPLQGKVIDNGDSLALTLSQVPGVAAAVPVVEERALAAYGTRQTPVRMRGVGMGIDSVTRIHDAIIDGQFLPEHFATISVGVANQLLAHPGPTQPLRLYAPRRRGRLNPSNPMASFRGDSLAVSGVFQINQPEYDQDFIVVPLATARRLLSYTTQATAIDIALLPGADADAVRQAVDGKYAVLTQMQQQEEAFRMIAIEKWITFMMLAFILLIASFNIISTLSMLLVEKRDNIATLRALGASQGLIRGIFTAQGWLITCLGGVVGIVLGVALALAQQYGHFIRLNADPTTLAVNAYPVRVLPADLLIVVALVAAVGALTSACAAYLTRRR